MFSKILTALCGGLALASAYTDEAIADQITNLPGAEKLDLNFNQFSGYLTVGTYPMREHTHKLLPDHLK